MEKTAFCDSIQKHLTDLERLVQSELTLAPATLGKAQDVAARTPVLQQALQQIAAVRSQLDTLRAEPGPLTSARQTSIEADLAAISQLLRG